MAGQRFEGTSLEEALSNAATSLGVDRFQLGYHVVTEKRGFLGGIKNVVIEAHVVSDAEPPPHVIESALRSDPSATMPEVRRGRGRGRDSARPRRPERAAARNADLDRGRGRRDTSTAEPLPPQGTESEHALKVRAWFEEVVDLTRLDLEFRTFEDESAIRILLGGRDGELLLDRGGELLDSLQVLVNKALVGRSLEKLIELDCHGFKQQRTNDIEKKARSVAEQVARDGREQLLPAMSPIERRIVHLALQEHRAVATESRGEGFFKRIAIVPKQADSPAAPDVVV